MCNSSGSARGDCTLCCIYSHSHDLWAWIRQLCKVFYGSLEAYTAPCPVRIMAAASQSAQHIEEYALYAQPPATQTVISGTANPATVPAGAPSTVTGAVTDPTGAGTPTGAVSLNVSLHMALGLSHACEIIRWHCTLMGLFESFQAIYS